MRYAYKQRKTARWHITRTGRRDLSNSMMTGSTLKKKEREGGGRREEGGSELRRGRERKCVKDRRI